MESGRTDRLAGETEPTDLGSATPPAIDSVIFARNGEAMRGRLGLTAMTRLLAAGVAPDGEIDWQVRGFSGLDELQRRREFLEVRTCFSPVMPCSKCLEPVQVHDLATVTRFRQAATEGQAAQEDRESETDEVIAANAHLDLSRLVEDEALLALPMAPSHPGCVWSGAGSGDSDNV